MQNFHLNLNIFKHPEMAHRGAASQASTCGTERSLVYASGPREREDKFPMESDSSCSVAMLTLFPEQAKTEPSFPNLTKVICMPHMHMLKTLKRREEANFGV